MTPPDPPPPDSRELFDFLLEHIPDLIFFKDRHSRFLRANRALLNLFGLKNPEDVVGRTDFDFLQPDDAERTRKDEQNVMTADAPIVGHVSKKLHADGTPWWAVTTKLPLKNAAGEIIGTCGISRDITQLKEAEDALARSNRNLEKAVADLKTVQAQLFEAEKAQTVARLAAGIAHEVRNPLTILSTGLEYLASEADPDTDPTRALVLQEMRDAIGRANGVIRTLMDGSRPTGLNREPCDLNRLVEDLLARMAGYLQEAGVRATTDLAPDLPPVNVDADKIAQVLEGLVTNAREAMPDGGELHIRTRARQLTAGEVTHEAGARGGQLFRAGDTVVSVEVEDEGSGIPEGVIPRIFDPFFTTKDTGPRRGLGLGLTVCRALIDLHGGILEMSNREKARGARLTILLQSRL